MLPTKIAKANVSNIQASDTKEINRENIFSMEGRSEKSFSTKAPSTIPPKSDNITFFVYSAKIIARSDGKTDKAESSMLNQSKFYR
ncbi:MAG: hypothetical protein M0Q17_05850 [Sulfurimonas sp.]|nr:hypothetical protein [Sulfurimonas sp.]